MNRTHLNFVFFLLSFSLSASPYSAHHPTKSSCLLQCRIGFLQDNLGWTEEQKFSSIFKLRGFLSSQPTSHVQRADHYAFVQKTVLIHFPQRTLKFIVLWSLNSWWGLWVIFLSFLKILRNTLWDLQKKVSDFLLLLSINTDYPREWVQLGSEPQPVRNDHMLVSCGSQWRLLILRADPILAGMDKQPDSPFTSWSQFWLQKARREQDPQFWKWIWMLCPVNLDALLFYGF